MKLTILPRAERDLQALGDEAYRQIKPVINSMEINLQSLRKKKLQGYDNRWRIRVGDWRIIYEENKATDTIYVISVEQRKDVYRH